MGLCTYATVVSNSGHSSEPKSINSDYSTFASQGFRHRAFLVLRVHSPEVSCSTYLHLNINLVGKECLEHVPRARNFGIASWKTYSELMVVKASASSVIIGLFFCYVLPKCSAKEQKCTSSISTFVASSSTLTRATILGKTYSELISLGFAEKQFSEYCSRLLMTEKESVAVVFPNSFACVKHFCQSDPIRHVQEGPRDVNEIINREMLWHLCDGSCAVQMGNAKAIVRKTGSRVQWELRHGDFLFRKTKPMGGAPSLFLAVFVLTAALVFRFQKALVSPGLLCVLVLLFWLYMREYDKGTHYSLVVKEQQSLNAVNIGSFVLHNFSYSVIRRGYGRCAIYSCNRFEGVKNIRFRTHCDVLNFRVPSVTRRGRSVKLNWLKVLTGIWLLEHKEYEHIVYTDRDLILDRDPAFAFEHPNVVFSDLGGTRPDSAMFIFRKGSSTNHLLTLHSWLRKETGQTTRRDDGEEQAALFDLPKNLTHVPAQRLYTFQCGRNSINRAECLLRRRAPSVDSNVFFSKLFLETLRPFIFGLTPHRFLAPTLLFRDIRHSFLKELVPLVLPLLEVIIYQRWVAEPPVRELRCPPMSTKAISYGSFDNPYSQTFSSLSTTGVVSRTPKGWVCTDIAQEWRPWNHPRLSTVESFAIAQFLICILSYLLGFRHFLDPAWNAKNLRWDKAKSNS